MNGGHLCIIRVRQVILNTVFGWFKCWSSHVFNFNVNPNFPKEIKENAWKKGTVVNQLALLSRTCTSYFTDASAFLGQVKTFVSLRVRLLWSCSDAVRYMPATGFFLLFFPPILQCSSRDKSISQSATSCCDQQSQQLLGGFIWRCLQGKSSLEGEFYLFAEYAWVPDKKSYRLR